MLCEFVGMLCPCLATLRPFLSLSHTAVGLGNQIGGRPLGSHRPGPELMAVPFLLDVQKTADSESEDRKATACLVKDSGYWNKEPCPASGCVSKTAFARFSLNR
jgi:hypothetical protein